MTAFTDAWDVIRNGVDILEDLRAHYDATQAAQLTTALNALTGDYLSDGGAAALAGIRRRMSDSISGAVAASWLVPGMLRLGQIIDSPNVNDIPALMQDIYDYMHTNTVRVETRNITHGAWTAWVSNTGTGLAHLLSVDEEGYDIESCYVETKTMKCIADGNMERGVRGAERFLVYGTDPSPDMVALAGSGRMRGGEIVAAHAGTGDGGSLLTNSSFDATVGATDTDAAKFPGWTIAGTPANMAQVTSTYYVHAPNSANDYCIEFETNEKITQKISVAGNRLKPRTPYYLQIAYMRKSSADGTLTIRMGSQTKAATVSSATNDVWNILRIDVGTGNWYRNFVEDDMNIEIELSSRTTGTVYVDNVVFVPFTPFDSLWHVVVAGATAYRLDDYFTSALTGGSVGDGKINYWLWRAGLGYLPNTAAATPPEIVDP